MVISFYKVLSTMLNIIMHVKIAGNTILITFSKAAGSSSTTYSKLKNINRIKKHIQEILKIHNTEVNIISSST
ncbi:hypothetical protein BK744_09340 [Bacillus thuringiensis serovar zhaodongensis]|nr:hypothetical protein BK744_09340 [Bacillus thuringiensis serovar zhaodongensis]